SRIVESVGATVCICSNTFFKAGLSLIISSKLCSMRISSEVEFLLAEFAHPVNDLPIRERVFHPDGYLIGDMLQQLRVLLRKGLVPQARHHQGTERTAVRNQWQAIGRLESLAQYALRDVGAEL